MTADSGRPAVSAATRGRAAGRDPLDPGEPSPQKADGPLRRRSFLLSPGALVGEEGAARLHEGQAELA